jgi:excisionase family DNA binding protein
MEETPSEPPETPADVVITDPAYWLARPEALQEALQIAADEAPVREPTLPPPEAYERYRDLIAQADPATAPAAEPDQPADLDTLPDRAGGEPRRLTLTVEEAAELLGISRALAYEAVRRGEIPSLRIGRRILVPRSGFARMFAIERNRRWLEDQPPG